MHLSQGLFTGIVEGFFAPLALRRLGGLTNAGDSAVHIAVALMGGDRRHRGDAKVGTLNERVANRVALFGGR
jgi:hypothetical protein